jgi:SAM-dependent methyltransferase
MSIPSESDFMQTMRAFQQSRVLLTAVELDVFTAVGQGATASDVATRVEANPRATETLLNALAGMGYLSKANEVFRNTEMTARCLVEGSADYARPALMHTVRLWQSWSTLTAAVRAGTAVTRPGIDAEDPLWTQSFIAAMHSNAKANAEAVVQAVGTNGVRRLLDVGGGSGAYSIAFAQANPALLAELLDLGPVVPIAQQHIDAAGLTGRVVTRIGDLTKDDLGREYDLILLSAICHMLSPEDNLGLFRRCRRALAPGGRTIIRDFILDPDKTRPCPAAVFALNMLVNTRAGSTYSYDEYRAWLESAGFRHVTRILPSGDLIAAS